jgi:hypothetical protein
MCTPKIGTRFLIVLLLAVYAALIVSCTTMRVPLRAPSYPEQEMLHRSQEGIDLAVRPIEHEDEYWQLFDDNLPSIGIVALWLEARNQRDTAIELPLANWSLRIGGRSYPAISVDELFKRYYDGYRVRMYSIKADRSARRDMARVAFQPGRIEPSMKREGFLFFRINPEVGAAWNREASLLLHDVLPGSRSKTTIEIALSHANP